jgi:hypothetical protein
VRLDRVADPAGANAVGELQIAELRHDLLSVELPQWNTSWSLDALNAEILADLVREVIVDLGMPGIAERLF